VPRRDRFRQGSQHLAAIAFPPVPSSALRKLRMRTPLRSIVRDREYLSHRSVYDDFARDREAQFRIGRRSSRLIDSLIEATPLPADGAVFLIAAGSHSIYAQNKPPLDALEVLGRCVSIALDCSTRGPASATRR
jgi:hypothetical protein